jgi:hypothetical protein
MPALAESNRASPSRRRQRSQDDDAGQRCRRILLDPEVIGVDQGRGRPRFHRSLSAQSSGPADFGHDDDYGFMSDVTGSRPSRPGRFGRLPVIP